MQTMMNVPLGPTIAVDMPPVQTGMGVILAFVMRNLLEMELNVKVSFRIKLACLLQERDRERERGRERES